MSFSKFFYNTRACLKARSETLVILNPLNCIMSIKVNLHDIKFYNATGCTLNNVYFMTSGGLQFPFAPDVLVEESISFTGVFDLEDYWDTNYGTDNLTFQKYVKDNKLVNIVIPSSTSTYDLRVGRRGVVTALYTFSNGSIVGADTNEYTPNAGVTQDETAPDTFSNIVDLGGQTINSTTWVRIVDIEDHRDAIGMYLENKTGSVVYLWFTKLSDGSDVPSKAHALAGRHHGIAPNATASRIMFRDMNVFAIADTGVGLTLYPQLLK